MTSRSDADELKDASQKLLEEKAVNSINVGDDSDDSRVKSLQSKSETAGVEIIQDVDAPHPPAQHIATSFPSLEVIKDDNSSSYATAAAPLPIEHIVAAMEAFDDNIDGISAIKLKIHSNASAHQVNSDADDNEVHDTRVESSNARVYSSTPSGNDEEQAPLRPNNTFRRQIGVKDSTTSTSMSMDEAPRHVDVDQGQDGASAFTVLEATLVDDKVYDAIPFEMNQEDHKADGEVDVAHSPGWCKRNARRVLVGMVTITVALTATIAVIIMNNKKGSNEQASMKAGSSNSVWIEQGQPIFGQTDHGKLGALVTYSADGSTLAVGVPGSYDDMNQIGYVKMYRMSVSTGVSWEKIGEDIRGSIMGDNFGVALDLSADGKILAVGAPSHGASPEDANSTPGYARVYYLTEGDDSQPIWRQVGKDINGKAPADNFGTVVSLSGDGRTVAISAMRSDKNDTVLDSGHVTIFEVRDEGNVWTQLGGDNDEEASSSLSGWIASAESNWTQLGQDILGDENEGNIGYSLSLSADGRTVAIGSPKVSGPNKEEQFGSVKLYTFDDAASSWVQLGLNVTGKTRGDEFGYYMTTSADGRTLAIGSPATENANNPGWVRVLSLNDGQQIGEDIVGTTKNGEFGSALALSEDGKTIAVGDQDTGNQSGSVRVFKFNALNSTWAQHGEAINESEGKWELFGFSVSLSGDGKMLAVGTPYYADGYGTVRIFFDKS